MKTDNDAQVAAHTRAIALGREIASLLDVYDGGHWQMVVVPHGKPSGGVWLQQVHKPWPPSPANSG